MTWNGCWRGEKKHHRMHRCDRFSQTTNWAVREPRHAGLFILLDSDFVQITSLKFELCCAVVYLENKTGVSHIFCFSVKAAWLILSRMVRDQPLQLFSFMCEQTTHLIFTTLRLWLKLSLLQTRHHECLRLPILNFLPSLILNWCLLRLCAVTKWGSTKSMLGKMCQTVSG